MTGSGVRRGNGVPVHTGRGVTAGGGVKTACGGAEGSDALNGVGVAIGT